MSSLRIIPTGDRRDELEAITRKAKDEIDRAYWAFTRQARAKPPSLVCPDAFDRKREAEALLKDDRCCDTCGKPLRDIVAMGRCLDGTHRKKRTP